MQIAVDDTALAGFNDPAKAELEKAASGFIDDLIQESNRIEAARNPSAASPQVTSGMVLDAAVLVRRGLAQPKKKIGVKLLRIISAVLSLVVGFTYDTAKLQDKTYMLVFIVAVAAAIIAVTIATIVE